MNINEMRQSFDDLMAVIEGMDQSAEDYSAKVTEAEELKAKIEQMQADADKVAKLKQVEFPKAKTAQSVGDLKIHVKGKYDLSEDPKCGFESAGEFLNAVYKAGDNYNQDNRLAHIVQTSGTHTTINDGLMIPTEFAQGLLLNESGITEADWMGHINVEETSSNSKTFKRSSSNTLGGSTGITAARISENTQMSSTREVFETTVLPLHKLYVYSEVTEEDLEDIAWLSSHLTMQAPKVMRKKLAGEFLNGTGVGEGLGMFNTNNANKIAVTRDTASTVKAEDIAAMYARFIKGAGSFWLINRDVMAKLPLMTVGDEAITWEPYFRDGMIGIMNGLPVYESEHCSALGTQGDVRLINPEGYRALQKVGGSKFNTSMHVKFDYDLTAFRWCHRISSIPWCNDVYTPTNGSTLSPFVELN
jgi:HK97 family phage major capsid protein